MKLLIADDNSKFRTLLRTLCQHLFKDIIECEDGDEAVFLCEKEKPDWILMDIKMKRVDGLSATRQIKKSLPATRIIIISQFMDKTFIDEAFKVGAVDYVNKEDLSVIENIIKEN